MLLRSAAWMAVIIMIIVACSASQKEVPASDILSQVREGQPIYYDGVSVAGDLNLSSLENTVVKESFILVNSTVSQAELGGVSFTKEVILWGTTFGNASFAGATFLGKADLSNTSFNQASFAGTSFRQPVTFDGATFAGSTDFQDAQFDKDASLNQVKFSGGANFNYSSFGYYSYFSGACFAGRALFSDVAFKGACDFTNANFTGEANFFQADFQNAVGFDGTVFGGPAQFGQTGFSGLSSFGEAIFAKEANFNLARFSEAAYLSGAEFRGLALFGLTKFQDIASFQQAQFDGDLNFKGGSISTILLDKAKFGKNSRIILNDTDFSRFKAHWNEIEEHVVWDPGAYLALVNNYHGLGWSADEDDCYYQYRRLNQGKKLWGWSKAIDLLAWLSCGYGVRPGYAVAWSLLTILAFALLFWRGDGIRRSARPLKEPAEVDSVPERVTRRNALVFSPMVWLSQGPRDFLPLGKNRYYVILEGILGWLLLALFLVTLGRVMIR
ncbi:MAG: pentapeptide repeat-containing protein [Methanothrix sp.]|nr:pentapeptide repeat-containing protein [Methanothrix sp.]